MRYRQTEWYGSAVVGGPPPMLLVPRRTNRYASTKGRREGRTVGDVVPPDDSWVQARSRSEHCTDQSSINTLTGKGIGRVNGGLQVNGPRWAWWPSAPRIVRNSIVRRIGARGCDDIGVITQHIFDDRAHRWLEVSLWFRLALTIAQR